VANVAEKDNKNKPNRNYDAYEDMRRICAYPKKYMITCPELLYEKMQEKVVL
jgi:hypothetical protein